MIKYELKGNNMVIKRLKTALISVTFVPLVLNGDISMLNIAEIKKRMLSIPQPNDNASSNIHELVKPIKDPSENLDKISSVLEFIAQAIAKGSITLKNKKIAKKWIKDNQEQHERF